MILDLTGHFYFWQIYQCVVELQDFKYFCNLFCSSVEALLHL